MCGSTETEGLQDSPFQISLSQLVRIVAERGRGGLAELASLGGIEVQPCTCVVLVRAIELTGFDWSGSCGKAARRCDDRTER